MYKYKKERYEMVKSMKNVMMGSYVKGDELIDFNFGTDLSAFDKLKFVNSVVETLVDDSRYDSIVRDLIFDFNIIRIFTDINTSFINAQDDDGNKINPIIPIERFLDETNVVDIVKANMEVGLLDELNHAVNQSIEYRTGIHPNPLNEALASLVNTLEKKVNEFDMSGMAEMAQKFINMTGELTPEKFVDAYVNSDMHKKNIEEIAESKAEKAEFAEVLDAAIKAVNEKNKTGE